MDAFSCSFSPKKGKSSFLQPKAFYWQLKTLKRFETSILTVFTNWLQSVSFISVFYADFSAACPNSSFTNFLFCFAKQCVLENEFPFIRQ